MAKQDIEPTPPAAAAAPSSGPLDRVEYRPNPAVHLSEAGPVAVSQWVGRIGNKRVRVYRGAQASKIPDAVRKAMAQSGVLFEEIHLETLLGTPQHPGVARARVISSSSEL